MLSAPRSAFALLLAATLTPAALAQTSVTLRLDRVEDFFPLILNPVTPDQNAFFVGTALSCIETDGTPNNWFIGGIQGGAPNQPWDAQVVKIEFDFSLSQGTAGYRNFRAITSTQTTAPGDFTAEGITGMDYAAGAGLLIATDIRQGQPGKIKTYDVISQLNPILLASSPTTTGRAGSAGPSWDFGPGGTGVPYQQLRLDANGGIVVDEMGNRIYDLAVAPFLATTIRFGDRGPRASLPNDLDFGANTVSPFKCAYFAGNGGLLSGAIPGSPFCVDNTFGTNHRDVKIHPNTGVIAIRSQADLILASRDVGGLVQLGGAARLGPTIDSGFASNVAPGVIGERVQMLVGAPGGDLVVWNQREVTAAGQEPTAVIKFNRLPATIDAANPDSFGAVQATYTNADGTPFAWPQGIGMYDFVYIAQTQQLVILDSNAGAGGSKAYVFTVNPAPATCPADFNLDGVVNPDDLADYIGCFFAVPACAAADFNQSGTVDPDDLADYIGAYFGAPCG